MSSVIETVRASDERSVAILAFEWLVPTGTLSGEARWMHWTEADRAERARGKPTASPTLSELLRELKIAAVAHGIRSSFRDWATEETAHPGRS